MGNKKGGHLTQAGGDLKSARPWKKMGGIKLNDSLWERGETNLGEGWWYILLRKKEGTTNSPLSTTIAR